MSDSNMLRILAIAKALMGSGNEKLVSLGKELAIRRLAKFPLDLSPEKTTITAKTSEDGGKGSGNFGHKGRPGELGGSASSQKGSYKKECGGRKLSKEEQKKISEKVIGTISSQGVKVTKISSHAFDRLGGRQISAGRLKKMLESEDVKRDPNYSDRKQYDIPGSRLILSDRGEVVTVMWRRNGKGKRNG